MRGWKVILRPILNGATKIALVLSQYFGCRALHTEVRIPDRAITSIPAGKLDFLGLCRRLGAVAILAAIPAARTVAFRCDRREISLLEVAFWIVGIILTERLGQGVSSFINAAFPADVFGFYPRPNGWLYFD
jgi:hypothetical protein